MKLYDLKSEYVNGYRLFYENFSVVGIRESYVKNPLTYEKVIKYYTVRQFEDVDCIIISNHKLLEMCYYIRGLSL